MIEKNPRLTEEERAQLGKPGKCANAWCKSGKPGVYCINPYHEDVNGSEYLDCLCDDCHQDACDDI
jgi:hypothetical protein